MLELLARQPKKQKVYKPRKGAQSAVPASGKPRKAQRHKGRRCEVAPRYELSMDKTARSGAWQYTRWDEVRRGLVTSLQTSAKL